MDASLKTLRSELKLNTTQMKAAGESAELLKNRQKILTSELTASREKTVLLNNKLNEAKKVYGENSLEAQRWQRALTESKNTQQAIQNELEQTNAKLREQENANSELSQSIEKSDSKMRQLDQELELNATKLEGTANKTELLKEKQNLLGEKAKESATKVKTLEQALDTCGREVGENSAEYADLKSKLVEAKTQQQAIQNEINQTTTELKNQSTQLDSMKTGFEKFGSGATKVGQSLRGVSTAAAAGLAGAGAAAITFESAFAGVMKTTDEVYDSNGKCTYSYKELENGIRNMAKEIPSSTTEISKVAETAGQLGVKTEDILGFTRVMIDMGNSTNLASDEAASSIAKFANVTGLAADQNMSAEEKYRKVGSTIVDLGNNYATTEADIMAMAQNLASAGTQIGMSESDILALATALSSVGMEAQAGGTAFSKAMVEMQLAVETNSDSLKDWADVAGMSTDEFARKFKEDATGAMEAFIIGLSKCGGETESAIKVLDDMGITETRMRDALLRSANASDVFTSAISTGKTAWEENTALTEEAEKRYATTASQLSIMKNKINDVGITLGSIFLPMINGAVEKVSGFTEKIADLDQGTQKTILGIVAFVAILSPLLIGIGKVSTGISAVMGVGSKLAGMFAGAGAAATGSGTAAATAMAAPLGPALAIVAAVAAVIAILVLLWNKSEDFREFFTGMWEGFKEVIQGFLEKIDFGDKIDGIKEKFSGLSEKLTGLTDFFKVLATMLAIYFLPTIAALSGTFNALVSAIEPIITIIGGVVDVLSGLGSIIVGIFTGDLELAKEGASTFITGIGEIFGGLWDLVSGALTGFVSGIFSFFSSLLETCGINGFIEGVAEKFRGIGETVSGVFQTIGNIVQVGIMFIGEVFSFGFQIITLPFRFIWENCKGIITDAWTSIKTTVSGAIQTVKSIVLAGFNLVKTYIITPITSAYTSVKSFFSQICTAISGKVSQAKSIVMAGFNLVKTNIITPITSAYSSVKSVFTNIYNAISSKITSAKNTVKSAIDAIKGFFNFSWKLPDLKLPHVNISGKFSINPPSVPKFSIKWYKDGAIFDKPTLFQTMHGWKGVGEAGPEAVAPLSKLMGYVEESVNRAMQQVEYEKRDLIDYDKLAEALSKQPIIGTINEREVMRILRDGGVIA